MSNTIELLKRDHREILDILKDAKEQCVSTKEGFAVLLSARERLLSHLEGEDIEIYPALQKAAESNEYIRRTLSFFEKELTDVSDIVRDFFSRYNNGCNDMDFIQDFGTLFIMLKERMAREENILFPEYEKLVS